MKYDNSGSFANLKVKDGSTDLHALLIYLTLESHDHVVLSHESPKLRFVVQQIELVSLALDKGVFS